MDYVKIVQNNWKYIAIGVGAFVVYSFAKSKSGNTDFASLVAQNTTEALASKESQNNLAMMQLQADTAITQSEIASQTEIAKLTIASNTAAYMNNVNMATHESEYAQGLIAAQNIAAMETKAAVATGISSQIGGLLTGFLNSLTSATTTAATVASETSKQNTASNANNLAALSNNPIAAFMMGIQNLL